MLFCIVVIRFWNSKQIAAQLDHLRPVTVGEQAVMANAVEAIWQNMQQEPAHEVISRYSHGLAGIVAIASIVLPFEGDPTIFKFKKTAIGDGHPVRITGEIGENLFWPRERALGIDNPF